MDAACPNCGESVEVVSVHFFGATPKPMPLPLECSACGVRSLFVAHPPGVDEDGPKDERMEVGTGTFRRLR